MRQLYPTQGKGGRSIPGEYVTITPAGNMAISAGLLRRMPEGTEYMRLEHDDETCCLYLLPFETPVDGCLKMLLPDVDGKYRGVQARLCSRSGLRAWGLIPVKRECYAAEWVGAEIIVHLDKRFGQESDQAKASHGEAPAAGYVTCDRGEYVEEAIVWSDPQSTGRPARVSSPRGMARRCETCSWWQEGKCWKSGQRNYGMHKGAADLCICWFPRSQQKCKAPPSPTEPPRQTPAVYPAVHPKELCPRCGHEVVTSASGKPWSHDVNGVAYRGDAAHRADKNRPCV